MGRMSQRRHLRALAAAQPRGERAPAPTEPDSPAPVAATAASAAARRRAELAQAIRDAERGLYTAHQGDFSPAASSEEEDGGWYYDPPAQLPDLGTTTVALYEELSTGMSWYRFAARRRAKTRAAAMAVQVVQRQAAALEAHREQSRGEAEHRRRLLLNDDQAVLQALDEVLHDIDAVAERVEGGVAVIRLLVPDVDALIGAQEPVQTATGRLTVKKRSQSRRHLLYGAVLASRTIRVAKTAFAAVPKLAAVRVIIDQTHEYDTLPVYCGLIRRSARVYWETEVADPEVLSRALAAAAEVTINQNPRTGELRPLAQHPSFDEAFGEIARAA